MATKKTVLEELADGRGPLGRVDDDEPIFILRAQDITAPGHVLHWAHVAALMGCPKMLEAIECATQMREWQQQHHDRVKWPA